MYLVLKSINLISQTNKHTRSDVIISTIPIGINNKPIIKNTGNAVSAVIIGCHAGKRCCLKAVSITQIFE
jgi:hypothetical protein